MKDDCIFCRMVAGQVPVTKIYEDQTVLAFLDIGPLSEGHTLVIPKQHFDRLHDCPGEILEHLGSVLGRIAKAVAVGMNYDGYNVLCNNARAAGQLVEHVHFHIIGRKTADGLFSFWPAGKYQEGVIEAVAEKIRKNL